MKDIILSDEKVLEIIELCKEHGFPPSKIINKMIEAFIEKYKEE